MVIFGSGCLSLALHIQPVDACPCYDDGKCAKYTNTNNKPWPLLAPGLVSFWVTGGRINITTMTMHCLTSLSNGYYVILPHSSDRLGSMFGSTRSKFSSSRSLSACHLVCTHTATVLTNRCGSHHHLQDFGDACHQISVSIHLLEHCPSWPKLSLQKAGGCFKRKYNGRCHLR